jgi:hypothetical protein
VGDRFAGIARPAQQFHSGLLTHGFVPSGHGNTHFWRNDPFSQLSRPASGKQTFVSIRINAKGKNDFAKGARL